MKLIQVALERRRLVLAAVIMLALIGLAAWWTMDRQEDPFFPYRYGHILVPWEGAEPDRVQRLVLELLEQELAQVEEVNEIRGTARLGLAHVIVGMHQHVYDTDSVWERIRVAVARAERKFPDGAGPATVRDRSMDTHGIVLAITGSDDLLELLDAARALKRDLFRIPDIGRVELLADPGEQVVIGLDAARAASLGLDAAGLGRQLHARNQIRPGGTLAADARNLVLTPDAEFKSLAELESTPVRTASGALIPLSVIADISLAPAEPATERMWFNGRPAIGLGIVIPENRLNAVDFGRQVRELVAAVERDYAPLEINEMFFQPHWVESRLAELGRSLLLGVVIVALVLLTSMGMRLGLLVASLLPLVTLSALAVFAIGGGVLHQMAIAGMVIALGMLVDNAIVMAENLQWHLDRGVTRAQAAANSVAELAGPLAAATGTTLAAFTPLLLSRGDTADFTRAIPVMVMLTLLVSYCYAMVVTPATAAGLLNRNAHRPRDRFYRLGERLGGAGLARPGLILAVTAVLLLAAAVAGTWLPRDFFPSTDRNQLVVDLTFPEGTRVEHAALQAAGIGAELGARPEVTDVHIFAGSSGPRFYYNLIEMPSTPHRARVVAISRSDRELPALIDFVRARAPQAIPEAQVVARRLGQGPPVDAPVEIRLFGHDPGALQTAADRVMGALRGTPGAVDVRHKLGTGLPVLEFAIDDAEAARFGVARDRISEALADATLGRPVSVWRAGREPVPMRIRAPEGEHLPHMALEGLSVQTGDGAYLPLARFVDARITFQPAVIEHRDLRRMTAVLAETADGVTYNQVLDRLQPRLAALDLPDSVEVVIGGSAAEAGAANTALFQTLPIGILLLLAFLLWQFNSFRLVGVVLVTVPLAAIGVIPGLLLAGQPFSFTAILGVVALVGIVVNNAIVMIDLAENLRRAGEPLNEAIRQAVARRTRPILLTTATTVAGLLPLTFTQSTLWPPMAWAIISGLIASSALTLLVIPVLYRLLMAIEPPAIRWRRGPATARAGG